MQLIVDDFSNRGSISRQFITTPFKLTSITLFEMAFDVSLKKPNEVMPALFTNTSKWSAYLSIFFTSVSQSDLLLTLAFL